MRKKLIYLIMFVSILTFNNIDVNAVELKTDEIDNSTYVIGTCMYTREKTEAYSGVLTTDVIMFASQTINSSKLEDMIIYYKNARGKWMDVLKNESVDMSETIEIDCKNNVVYLQKPTLSSQFQGYDEELQMYMHDVTIDYMTYLNEDDTLKITGWELYVTSDDNPGNEMVIDGVGYFLHSTHENQGTVLAYTEPGKTYKYRTRVYLETENGKVYSDFSEEYVIENSVKTPTLAAGEGYGENGIDYETLTIMTQGAYAGETAVYMSGWELYEKVENEYILFKEYTDGSTEVIATEPGQVRTFVARVYVLNGTDEKVYSEYSNEYVVDNTVKTPTLAIGEGYGENAKDYAKLTITSVGAYVGEAAAYMSGWELYEKEADKYILIEDPTDWIVTEAGDTRTFVAKVYVLNSEGEKIYSEYSNELVTEYTILAPTLSTGLGSGSENGGMDVTVTIVAEGAYAAGTSSISGWELYEKADDNYIAIPVDGFSSKWITTEAGEVKTLVARVYVLNSKGEKIYSDYSNELEIGTIN